MSTQTWAASLQEKHDTLDTTPLQGRVRNVGGESGAFSENAEVAHNLVSTVAEGVLASSSLEPQVPSSVNTMSKSGRNSESPSGGQRERERSLC